MTALTTKQRFSGSFKEFDRLLFRIADPGQWLPCEGHVAYYFKSKNVRVTWFPNPKGYLVEGDNPLDVLDYDAAIQRLVKRLGFHPKIELTKPSARKRPPPLLVMDVMPSRQAKKPTSKKAR